MATKKAAGSTNLGRDSQSKRLGVKIYGGQPAKAGAIIIRQRGSHYREGEGVKRGGDDTLYAAYDGVVQFSKKTIKRFTGALKQATYVSVKAAK
jgi:large subunit ribosomal protein L27